MTLYNNRGIIVHLDKDKIYLFRHIDNKLIMNYYSEDNTKEDIISEDALGEFDIIINDDNHIYLLYQSISQYLHILTIDENVLGELTLTETKIPKVYELNIKKAANSINIIYAVLKSSENKTFEIHHYLLKDGKWTNFLVDEIKVSKALNPMKVLRDEDNILLFYYQENKISMRKFNIDNSKWDDPIVLTDNNDKLYLDTIKADKYFHLAYSKFQNNNLIIRYAKYLYKEDKLILEKEVDISKESNPSNPSFVIEKDRLWLVWNESSNILSRYSDDKGENWSSIYLWKESKYVDKIRYQYISKEKYNINLDYGFGTIEPDIKFIGFGPLDNVEEIKPNKEVLRSTIQIQ